MELEDTQPLESQIFRDHISRQATESLRNHNAEFTGDTRKTYETGQTGYVSLVPDIDAAKDDPPLPPPRNLGASPSRNMDGANDDDESEDELSSEPPMLRKTSPPKELSPKTPSSASQKRLHDGILVSSAYKTPVPDYKAFFSTRKSKATVGLSQLFGQTQADTSQMPTDELRSDPVFERPSPAFSAFEKTPGNATLSSPIQRTIGSGRTFPDPRSSYRSMEESQRAREETLWKLQKEKEELKAASDNDDLDEDSGQRKAARAKRRAQIEQESRLAFDTVKVDGVPVGSTKKRNVGRPRTAIGTSNQAPAKVRQHGIVAISSDDQEHANNASSEESLDEYEEYSSSILKKHRKRDENDFEPNSTSRSIKHDLVNPRPNSSPLPRRRQSATSSSAFRSKNQSSSSAFSRLPKVLLNHDRHTPQTAVIFNSQEDFQRPKPLEEPSSPTHSSSHEYISQSQVATLASDFQNYSAKTQLEHEPDTSSVPPVPGFDMAFDEPLQDDRDETRGSSQIPSSPPVMQSPLDSVEPNPTGLHEHPPQVDGSQTSKPLPQYVSEDHADPTEHSSCGHHEETTDVDSAFPKKARQKVPESSVVSRPSHQRSEKDELRGSAMDNPRVKGDSFSQEMVCSPSNSTGAYATAQTRQTPSPSKYNTSNQDNAIRTPRMLQPMSFAAIHKSAPSPGTPLQRETDVYVENDEDREYKNAVDPDTCEEKKPLRASKRAKLKHVPYRLDSESKHSTKRVKERDRENMDNFVPSDPPEERVEPYAVGYSSGYLSRTDEDETHNANSEPLVEHSTKSSSNRAIAETPQTAHKNVVGVSPRLVPANTHESPLLATSTSGATASTSQTRRRSLRSAPSVSADVGGDSPHSDVVAPNRILAKFRGSYMAYYPATLLGLSKGSASKYSVRFDDSTITDLERTLLVSLDFKIGDLVKVDRKGLKKTTYEIFGFKNGQSGSSEGEAASTDIYGRDTLILHPKQRQGLPRGINDQSNAILEVPVWNIYITETIWIHYARRPSPHLDTLVAQCKRLENAAAQQSISPAAPFAPIKSGMFANMVFAMTFLDKEEASKASMSRMIEENGGHIVKDKFDSLFDISVPSTPQEESFADLEALQPAASAANLGFVALITDSYSRRIKYIQALALNIPCLHTRWIHNCVKQQNILPWSQYLLPAGQSSILEGAVHSRVLSGPNNPFNSLNTTVFSAMVEHRLRLLDDANVLLFMGANKHDEKRKAFTFLAHAMGTKQISWVKSVTAARDKLTGNHDWNWVLVDETKVQEIREELLSDKKFPTQKGSKRKSSGRLVSVGSSAAPVVDSFRIIGDDHLVQCLISGASLGESVALAA
ncbi:MAG: hypothetical protein M1831_002431 [Alyxoria varia]|nr:MAG: hypothetical protein M1831_002431 [Alyxoria varia]